MLCFCCNLRSHDDDGEVQGRRSRTLRKNQKILKKHTLRLPLSSIFFAKKVLLRACVNRSICAIAETTIFFSFSCFLFPDTARSYCQDIVSHVLGKTIRWIRCIRTTTMYYKTLSTTYMQTCDELKTDKRGGPEEGSRRP